VHGRWVLRGRRATSRLVRFKLRQHALPVRMRRVGIAARQLFPTVDGAEEGGILSRVNMWRAQGRRHANRHRRCNQHKDHSHGEPHDVARLVDAHDRDFQARKEQSFEPWIRRPCRRAHGGCGATRPCCRCGGAIGVRGREIVPILSPRSRGTFARVPRVAGPLPYLCRPHRSATRHAWRAGTRLVAAPPVCAAAPADVITRLSPPPPHPAPRTVMRMRSRDQQQRAGVVWRGVRAVGHGERRKR
jgi:hypothetical protein